MYYSYCYYCSSWLLISILTSSIEIAKETSSLLYFILLYLTIGSVVTGSSRLGGGEGEGEGEGEGIR